MVTAVQQEEKARAVWDKQKRVKRGEIAPAQMQGPTRARMPRPVQALQFQKKIPSPLSMVVRIALPELSHQARFAKAADVIPDPADLLDLGPGWLPPKEPAPAEMRFGDPPRPASWTPWLLRTRLGYRPQHVTCPIQEPEAEAGLVAAEAPHIRCGVRKVRRYYAQSTPFRLGRRPYTMPQARLAVITVTEGQRSGAVADPDFAGLAPLAKGPVIEPGAREVLRPNAKPLRAVIRISATALIQSAHGTGVDLRVPAMVPYAGAKARYAAPVAVRMVPVRTAWRPEIRLPGAALGVTSEVRVPEPEYPFAGLAPLAPFDPWPIHSEFVRMAPVRIQPRVRIAMRTVIALAPARWSLAPMGTLRAPGPRQATAAPLRPPLRDLRFPVKIQTAEGPPPDLEIRAPQPDPPMPGLSPLPEIEVHTAARRPMMFPWVEETRTAEFPRTAWKPVPVELPVAAPPPPPQKAKPPKPPVSFVEPKPQPAFPKKPEARRYSPVMVKSGAPGKTAVHAKRPAADPPMAPGISLEGWVRRTGLRRIRAAGQGCIVPAVSNRKGPLFFFPPPPAPVFLASTPPRHADLKRNRDFAESRIGSRLGLLMEVSAPPAFWQIALRRWQDAPVVAKWGGVFLAMLLAGFALPLPSSNPRPPKAAAPVVIEESAPEPAAARAPKPAGKPAPAPAASKAAPPPPEPAPPAAPKGFLANFREGFSNRAAVNLADDFRSGLGDWAGDGNWSRGWAYDQAGFIRPGALGLYVPSVTLADYRMEFLGQIDRRALSWVVRAADTRNYHAIRLAVAEAGPVPKVVLERYAVVRGQAGPVKRAPIPFPVRNDTTYQVVTEVREGKFTVTIRDSIIDAWTETRLPRGGVGFFAGRGEQSRVRWMSVTHQNDFIGRICAMIAPPKLGGE